MSETLTLLSLNVRGLILTFENGEQFLLGVAEKNVDIVFLQETHSKKETEVQWRNEWGAGLTLCH